MNAIDCITGRRSIRQYTEQSVSREVLESVIAAAAYVPSWKNTQVTRYIAIEDEALRNTIADEYTIPFNAKTIKNAPLLVAVTMITGRSGFERDGSYTTIKEDKWQVFDAGIASQTFCLAAQEHGLGTVILGIFDYDKTAEVLKVEPGRELIALIAVGYPAESPDAPKRKSVEELLSYR